MNFKITNVLIPVGFFILFAYFLNSDFRLVLEKWGDNIFYHPCEQPIEYSIGSFDDKFGISQDLLLTALKEAEDLWEKPSGRDLFNYSSSGKLKVNLVYDYRQESTSNLNDIDQNLAEGNIQYNHLNNEYKNYLNEHNIKIVELNNLIASYDEKTRIYEAEINKWNKKQESSSKYEELVMQKQELERLATQIEGLEAEANNMIPQINQLAEQLNDLAKKLNINVEEYNATSGTMEERFEQGNYIASTRIKEINIYQFDDYKKLVLVLAHELGHAIGIDHINNADDIMYGINTGKDQKITNDAMNALEMICNK
ncbi:MAG: matrixin family metalloprotease [Candidatus Pacebacteria bacterium]|nr:matrixin family metalloprotease [Candidatus Paceibacterota bacterium]